MKKYLGLVDEYEIKGTYDEYIFAGEYCVNAIEWCKRNNKTFTVMTDYQKKINDIKEISYYLEKVQNSVILHAKSILNDYHKTNYNFQSWQILLNQWVAYYLPALYDKYNKLKYISEIDSEYYVDLYPTEQIDVAMDFQDFVDSMRDDNDFHRFQYSIMLHLMDGITNIVPVLNKQYIKKQMHRYDTGVMPEYVHEFIETYSIYKDKYKIEDDVVIQSSYIKFAVYKEIIQSNYGKVSGYFLNYLSEVRYGLQYEIDAEWRLSGKYNSCLKDEFIDLVCRALPYFLPIAYVENFLQLKAIALKNYKWGMSPKAVVYDCVEISSNELFKIYLMNIVSKGVIKIDIQHAIPYGFGCFSWPAKCEIQICDQFLTCEQYDKNYVESKKFVRMPYINMFRVNVECTNTNRIVYANYSFPQNMIGLSMAEFSWERYIEEERLFISKLDQDIVENELLVRMYPGRSNFWNNQKNLQQEFPKLRFDTEKNFFESIKNAKLVIVELFGSAAMEALAIGKPVIVLYSPLHLASEINCNYDDIEKLIEVGIITESANKLADTVNRICGDVGAWWNEPKRKSVVKKIVDKYIFFPDNSQQMWVDKISSFVK